MQWRDELGFQVELEGPPQRIVSLVPSLTETLFALNLDRQIAGVTKFCVEPAAAVAAIEKVGGTKNPNLRAILALQPDLVIANAEENRLAGRGVDACARPQGVRHLSADRVRRAGVGARAWPHHRARVRGDSYGP